MTGASNHDPQYIAARFTLLNALQALGSHRHAFVLVGAQAIYLRVGEGDMAVAPFTTDADLAIDPSKLEKEPNLEDSLGAAGFEIVKRPGTWALKSNAVQVDFLVPESLSGSGRRGARLDGHGNNLARKAKGLEASVVDNSVMTISSLDITDTRKFDISIAGVAALLIAKLHKISDRKNDQDRLNDKDALDILRLMRASDNIKLATTLKMLSINPVSNETTKEAHSLLKDLFSTRTGVGVQMAVRASAGLEDGNTIALSCEVLALNLLELWASDLRKN